jgi:hypothetical protein
LGVVTLGQKAVWILCRPVRAVVAMRMTTTNTLKF